MWTRPDLTGGGRGFVGGARQAVMGCEDASEKFPLNSLLFLSTNGVFEHSLGLLGLMMKVHNLCRV